MCAALFCVYVLWGATAPAIRFAVATVPPWFLASLRFLIAGSVLWFFARVRGVPLPSARDWFGAFLTGTILLVFGNGVFSWCLQYIPSGVGALFFALSPLWMALLGIAFYREKIAPLAGAGLVLGLSGMAYLVSPSGAEHLPAFATVLAVFSSIAWALGSMLQRNFAASDLMQMSGMQMLFGCVELGLASAFVHERVTPASFTPATIAALLFLAILGSIVAYSAYLWVMRNLPTTIGSTYSYVNPLVALAIGVTLLHESLTWHTLLGAGIIIAGVALMIAAPKPDARSALLAR